MLGSGIPIDGIGSKGPAISVERLRIPVTGVLQSPEKADALAAHDLISQAQEASHSVPWRGRRLNEREAFGCEHGRIV
jgi:hypothetical protein